MELIINRLRPAHGNAFRQMGIDTANPGRQRAIDRHIEMRHLMRRMHARIGPPSAQHTDRGTCNFPQRRLQRILHSAAASLTLPTTKGRAAILDPQCNPHHSTTPINPAQAATTHSVSRRVHGIKLR
jgi:hypothetical protein